MKKLTKILLVNWLYFSKQIIEVDDVNFLTGKNGAGKSTVIDALQIVLLGETNARNFNQAANEKSQRSLDGYLRADMDDNNPNSRRGKDFTSFIACEFLDDVEGTCFVTGVAFDCRSDGNNVDHFFIYDGVIPENGFVENGFALEYSVFRKQGYVVRPIRKELMDDAFIGHRAIVLRIARTEAELNEICSNIQKWQPIYQTLSQNQNRDSLFSIRYVQSIITQRQTDYLRGLEISKEMEKNDEELSHLDLFWLNEQRQIINTLVKSPYYIDGSPFKDAVDRILEYGVTIEQESFLSDEK